MRRQTGGRAALLATAATLLAFVAPVAVLAAPTTPPPAPATGTTTSSPPPSTPTGTTSGTPSGTPSGTASGTAAGTPTPAPSATTPASKGIPATFTGRLDLLRDQATTLQADLAVKTTAATTAIATYTATTKQVQDQLATAATAEQRLAGANDELDAAGTQLQILAHDTYVDRPPPPGTALLLTSHVDDIDFTVAALGYLADRSAAVYDRFTAARATAASFATAQQAALDRAKALQQTADGQRAVALTALGVARTEQATFVAAVTALRDDAAKAAGTGPLSPADTAAYQAFLTELNTLAGGVATVAGGTTYVAGGPGLTPLPGTAWVKPLLTYRISSCYCIRDGTFHHGVDLAAPSGTPIYAVGAGTVVAAGPANGFGNWVVIDHHDGSFSIYGHMRVLATVVGAQVTAGTLIAYVGDEGESTGYHLHFEVRLGGYGSATTSTDPVLWLAQRGVTL